MTQTKYFTPPQLAELWGCSPETVIGHIKAGRLQAFTLSPPTSKRPRWRITSDSIFEFERTSGANPPAATPRRSRPREPRGYIEYV